MNTNNNVNNEQVKLDSLSKIESINAVEGFDPNLTVSSESELTPLEKAMNAMCPIAKYKDKTLGEMIRIDPGALAYVAKSGDRYGHEIAGYAKLICEDAVQKTSA